LEDFVTTDTMQRTESSGLSAVLRKILVTEDRLAPAIMRLTLAVVMFPHGAQKMLGWFGGDGFSAAMTGFTEGQGLPWLVAFLVIIAEFLGSIGLALGVATRACAAGIAAVMVGAVLTVHLQYGFFMNWGGQKAGEGFEFHLLAIGLAIALMVAGGGKASLDRAITRRMRE
jgi:putative oxidoreductase